MNKIEELLSKIRRFQDTPEPIDTYEHNDIVGIMKEYAEFYAKSQCENLFQIMGHWSKSTPDEFLKILVETKLPNHEEL